MSLSQILMLSAVAVSAYAQPGPQASTSGATVIVPAFGEVRHANDEATATFSVEEQDKDKAAAASRVNLKMKQGTDILKQADPKASFKTYGYYTYAVYQDDRPVPGAQPKPRVQTGWRVGQYLMMKTTELTALPKTVAAAQKLLGLNGIQFGLSAPLTRQLEDQRIAATYQNLNERIASIASAMHRSPADAVIDTIDFEGSGNYAQMNEARAAAPAPVAMYKASMRAEQQVEEPSFEPGETTLQMRVVGRLKFK